MIEDVCNQTENATSTLTRYYSVTHLSTLIHPTHNHKKLKSGYANSNKTQGIGGVAGRGEGFYSEWDGVRIRLPEKAAE